MTSIAKYGMRQGGCIYVAQLLAIDVPQCDDGYGIVISQLEPKVRKEAAASVDAGLPAGNRKPAAPSNSKSKNAPKVPGIPFDIKMRSIALHVRRAKRLHRGKKSDWRREFEVKLSWLALPKKTVLEKVRRGSQHACNLIGMCLCLLNCSCLRVQNWHKREHYRRMIEDQKEMLKRDMNDPDKPLRNLVCVRVRACVRARTRCRMQKRICERVSEFLCRWDRERDCACVLTLTHRTVIQRK